MKCPIVIGCLLMSVCAQTAWQRSIPGDHFPSVATVVFADLKIRRVK